MQYCYVCDTYHDTDTIRYDTYCQTKVLFDYNESETGFENQIGYPNKQIGSNPSGGYGNSRHLPCKITMNPIRHIGFAKRNRFRARIHGFTNPVSDSPKQTRIFGNQSETSFGNRCNQTGLKYHTKDLY